MLGILVRRSLDKDYFRMNQSEQTSGLAFTLWWMSSSGDEFTKRFSPEQLNSFYEFIARPAERTGFSTLETLMLFTSILMDELRSEAETFQNGSEWLESLGGYWAAETARWKLALRRRLGEETPRLGVVMQVFRNGRLRQAKPTTASEFKDMIDNDRIEFFQNNM